MKNFRLKTIALILALQPPCSALSSTVFGVMPFYLQFEDESNPKFGGGGSVFKQMEVKVTETQIDRVRKYFTMGDIEEFRFPVTDGYGGALTYVYFSSLDANEGNRIIFQGNFEFEHLGKTYAVSLKDYFEKTGRSYFDLPNEESIIPIYIELKSKTWKFNLKELREIIIPLREID